MTKQRFEFRGCDMIDNKTDETTLCNKDGFEDLVYQLNEINKENEELKQFKDNVFDLIDKNIKETKELFEDGKIDLISQNGAMIILIGLKEELKGGDLNE